MSDRDARLAETIAAMTGMMTEDADEVTAETADAEDTVEAGPEDTGGQEPAPDEAQAEDRGLASIAREEARIQMEKAELKKQREELEAMMEQVKSFNSIKDRFNEDPIGVARELAGRDIPAEDLAAKFYSALPGGEETDVNKYDSLQARLDRLEKENQEYRTQAEKAQAERDQKAFQQKYLGEISDFMLDDATMGNNELEFVNAYFSSNKEAAVSDIFNIAARLASENPDGPLVSPAEAAKAVNEHLGKLVGPILEARSKKTEGKPKSAPKEKPPTSNRTLMNTAQTTTSTTDSQEAKWTKKERWKRGVAFMNSIKDAQT